MLYFLIVKSSLSNEATRDCRHGRFFCSRQKEDMILGCKRSGNSLKQLKAYTC